MISELLKRVLVTREAYRKKLERFFISIVEKRWYRLTAFLVSLLLFARIVDPSAGSVTPSPLARMPDWIFIMGVCILVPLFVIVFSAQHKENLKRYDPEAPEIKEMAKRWAMVGWGAVAFIALLFVSVVVFPDSFEIVPIWGIGIPFILAIFLAALCFNRASDMRTGAWSPPEWMPPMKSDDADEDREGEVD